MQSFDDFYHTPKRLADFTKTSTTTQNKLNIIAWENENFKKAAPKRGPGEQVLGVVGNRHQLERHLKQYVDLGFKYQNMHIVDFDANVARELKMYATYIERRGYIPDTNLRSRIKYDNIFNAIHNVPNLTHIDFDGVAEANNLPNYATALASIPTANTFCIVCSMRSGKALYDFKNAIPTRDNQHLVDVSQQLYNCMRQNVKSGIVSHTDVSHFKKHALEIIFDYSFLQDVIQNTKDLLPEFEMAYKYYKGKQPMVSFIFSKGTNVFVQPPEEFGMKEFYAMMAPIRRLIVAHRDPIAQKQAQGILKQSNFVDKYIDPILAYLYTKASTNKFMPVENNEKIVSYLSKMVRSI